MENHNVNYTKYNKPFIERRADPYMYKHSDGWYYFTGSVPAYDKIVLRRSSTIEGLKAAKEKTLWHKHEEGPQSIHIWAPELHYIMEKWYIYYAAGDKEHIWDIRPYILECQGTDPMQDTWKELGVMQAADSDPFSFHAFSLDSTVFENNGVFYFVWAEKTGVGKQISNIYIAEMDSPWKLKTDQILLTTPDYEWERVDYWVNEGPAVLKKNGKIFLTFSASATGACYCMGLLSIDENADILNPRAWTKFRHPVLKTDNKKQIYGPGHNSFVKSEDGKTDLCVYHARNYEKIVGNPLYDANRNTLIMEIKWNSDGNPIFNYTPQV